MTPTILLFLLQVTTEPMPGPAYPPSIVQSLRPTTVRVDEIWSKGCQTVCFTYRSQRPLDEVAKRLRKEGFEVGTKDRTGRHFQANRRLHGVSQGLSITAITNRNRPHRERTSPYTQISLLEMVDLP